MGLSQSAQWSLYHPSTLAKPDDKSGRIPLLGDFEARMRRLGAAKGGWLVAVSGGPDSFALLDLAYRSVHRTPRPLHAVTVHHHLRSEAEDELMAVRGWCDARNITHHRQDLEPPANPAAARHARYQALKTVAFEQKLPHILLGHHADDQVESILLALVRGAGPKGLGGMRDCRDLGGGIQVLRPFLEIPGQILRDHAQEHHLPFHDEPGNLDPQSARGRIRTLIRPQLELLRQGCGMAIVNNRALMQAAGQALQTQAKRLAQSEEREVWQRASEGLRLAALQLRAPNTPNSQLRPLCRAISEQENRPRRFAVQGGVMELTARALLGPKPL